MPPARPQARVAFFGGSFDPPHLGHLAVARAARQALGLDAVLFAPVGSQPLKPLGSTASFDDRLAMTRLAIAGEPGFEASLIDAPRLNGDQPAPPNYTIDTLATLRAVLPAEAELFCLVGADSFLSLRLWHRAAEIPFAAEMIVASRPGEPLDDLAAALPPGLTLMLEETQSFPIETRNYAVRDQSGRSARFYLLPVLHVDISATEIRAEVSAAATSLGAGSKLLPDAVAEFIRVNRLYR